MVASQNSLVVVTVPFAFTLTDAFDAYIKQMLGDKVC